MSISVRILGSSRYPLKYSCIAKILVLFFCLISYPSLGQQYLTNGIGEYAEFNERVLLIKLELENSATDSFEVIAVDTNKKLSFRIVKDQSLRSWSRIWIQNLSINNSPDTLSTQTDDLIAMTQAFKGQLSAGDLVEFERIASDLTILTVNGTEIEDFETPEFFEFLLSAFIGSVPPSGELKAALLSGGSSAGDLASAFDSLNYSQARANQIAAWIPAPAPTPAPEPVSAPVEETPVVEVEEPQQVAEVPEEVDSTVEEIETVPVEELEEPAVATEEIVEAEAEQIAATPVEETVEEVTEAVLDEPVEEDVPFQITAESLLAVQNYQRAVLLKVYGELEYPASALRRNREGSVRVSIGIEENGNLASVNLVQNAAYEVFDEATLDAVDAAAPFDPLPAGTLEIPMRLEIPITFRLD